MRSAKTLLATFLSLTTSAWSQSIYVDFDQFVPETASSAYRAGGPLEGFWNSVHPTQDPFTQSGMVDRNGVATGASMTLNGFWWTTGFDRPSTQGDDEALMDDVWWPVGTGEIRIDGLAAGQYRVRTYCSNVNAGATFTRVSVEDAVQGIQTVGSINFNGHQQPQTFALHDVSIAAGETLVILAEGQIVDPAIAGIQIQAEDDIPMGVVTCSAAGNSTGIDAELHLFGNEDSMVGPYSVRLRAIELPPNQFGFHLAATQSGFVPTLGGGQGTLCLGAPIARITDSAQSTGADGVLDYQLDVNNIPLAVPTAILAGETWHFQTWYRDTNPGPTSNLSIAVAVLFQ